MKTISSHLFALFAAISFLFVVSCNSETPTPTPEPQPETAAHFDVWCGVGGHLGMSRTTTAMVKSLASLESGTLDFKGNGVDVTATLGVEHITKGKYYYQVTKSGRFGKYQIAGDALKAIAEFPFPLLKERRHAHAWLDDKTLILVGASGESDKVLWAKIDVEQMKSLAEGELKLPAPKDKEVFNSSGMLAYRKADNTLIYTYVYMLNRNPARQEFYAAFINPSDMAIKTTATENRAHFMASTAYGELVQQKSFFDENGDYYLACNSTLENVPRTQQRGFLFRIKKGAVDFDKTYNGYNRTEGKIIAMEYLNNGKVLLYMQDPQYAGAGTDWANSFIFYYLIADLKSGVITDLKDQLPFSSGNFSQRFTVAGGKAYIGVNPEKSNACVYVYDIAKNTFTKGLTIAEGYAFERIVRIED